MGTVAKTLSELDEQRRRALARFDLIAAILTTLPGELPAPTVSNETSEIFGRPSAWLSFKWLALASEARAGAALTGSAILAQLETAGFEPLPLSLCKWGSWRAMPEPLAVDEVPETKNRDTLRDVSPLVPLLLEANNHTPPEARTFYRRDGRIFRVHVPGPQWFRVEARRHETRGSWYYEHSTARLIYPADVETIQTAEGESIAQRAAFSRAYVETEQGLSGVLYWEPIAHEQLAFPLTPAAFLALLEGVR